MGAMKRSFAPALITAALVFAPACKSEDAKTDAAADAKDAKDGKAKDGDVKDADAKDGDKSAVIKEVAAAGGADTGDSLKLVPDGAMVVGTIDLAMLAKMPAFNAGMLAGMVNDPEAREALTTMQSCGIQLNMFRRISFAGTEEGGKGMGIIDGKGISERSVLDCLAAKAKEKDGTVVTFTDGSGYTIGVADKDDMVIIAMGSDRLVLTTKKWQAEIEGRVKGEGVAAIDGGLKAAMPLADTSKRVWMVIGTSKELSGELKGQPLESMVGAGVWLDGDFDAQSAKSFDMGVKIGMPDDAKATAGKDFLTTQYAQVAPMAAMFGLPPGLADKVQFGTAGSTVTIGLSLNQADLKAIEAAAKKDRKSVV